MKRLLMALSAGALVFGTTAAFAADNDATFNGKVAEIVKWITKKQSPTTPATGLNDWDNELTSTSGGGGNATAETDSVAIFRLVTNVDVTLTASVGGPLDHTTTDEVLATFFNLQTDGDGATGTGGTGVAVSGIKALAANMTAAKGVGGTQSDGTTLKGGFLSPTQDNNTATGDRLYFCYVGGLDVTPTGAAGTTRTAPDHDDAIYSVTGTLSDNVTEGTFLGATGVAVEHLTKDGAILIKVTCRGLNSEDFGADSDNTEAPDLGDYTATLTLTATSLGTL